MPLSDAVGGSVDQIPVDRISGDLPIPYDELAQASGISGLTDHPGGRLAAADRLGPGARPHGPGEAVGRVEVADGRIVINAEQAKVAGIPVPQAVLDQAARLLSFRVAAAQPAAERSASPRCGSPTTALLVDAVSDDVVLRPDSVQ